MNSHLACMPMVFTPCEVPEVVFDHYGTSGACRCSVQRIAKRSGALAADRIALLNDIAFEWTGADALS